MSTTIAGLLKDTRTALLALIAARPAFADVQVTPTHPGGHIDSTQTVFINDTKGEAEWATLGQRRREVDPITIEVVVQTARAGDLNQQAVAEDAAWDLAADIEEAVAGDPTIGGTVRTALVVEVDRTNIKPTDTTWATQIVVNVQATARVN